MAVPCEIKLMEEIAEKLERFADDNTRLTRSLTGRFAGALPPADIDAVLEYLQNNAPNIVTVRQYYDELISLAKEIDRLVAESGASALESANRLMGKLGYQAHRLARTLRKTSQELTAEKPAGTGQNTTPAKMKYDVFICHASEDKKDFVKSLADALIREKLKVWYDEFELTLGDSLREKIDYGLANSEYGVVVLSEAFFMGKWPQNELDGLVARQNSEGKKVILPVWHKVSYDEVKRFSLTLAGKFAAQSEKGIKQVVDDILRVINYSDLQYKLPTTNKNTAEKPAKPERNTTPAKRWNIWTWLKGFIKEAYRITIKSFFDSAMNK